MTTICNEIKGIKSNHYSVYTVQYIRKHYSKTNRKMHSGIAGQGLLYKPMTVFEELFLNPHMGRVLSHVKGKPSLLTAPAFLPTDKLLYKGGGDGNP